MVLFHDPFGTFYRRFHGSIPPEDAGSPERRARTRRVTRYELVLDFIDWSATGHKDGFETEKLLGRLASVLGRTSHLPE